MRTPHLVKRKVEAGNIVEESVFLTSSKRHSRGRFSLKTELEKVRERFRYRVRQLARWLNANFVSGDYFVTLTYNRASYSQLKANGVPQEKVRDVSYHAAKKELHLFLKRCKYAAKKEQYSI